MTNPPSALLALTTYPSQSLELKGYSHDMVMVACVLLTRVRAVGDELGAETNHNKDNLNYNNVPLIVTDLFLPLWLAVIAPNAAVHRNL